MVALLLEWHALRLQQQHGRVRQTLTVRPKAKYINSTPDCCAAAPHQQTHFTTLCLLPFAIASSSKIAAVSVFYHPRSWKLHLRHVQACLCRCQLCDHRLKHGNHLKVLGSQVIFQTITNLLTHLNYVDMFKHK